jgi:hypothetical protein
MEGKEVLIYPELSPARPVGILISINQIYIKSQPESILAVLLK